MCRWRITLLFLAVGAALCAQDATTSTTTVRGRVFSVGGNLLSGATVTIAPPSQAPATSEAAGSTAPAAGQGTYVTVTGSGTDAGHFSIASIPSGVYDITVAFTNRCPQVRKGVVLSGDQQEADFVMDAPRDACGLEAKPNFWDKSALAWTTLLVVLAYVLNIWAVRWNNIARPNRELLGAEIDKVEARFRSETGLELAENDPQTGHLWSLLRAAKVLPGKMSSALDFLFWSRGQEITGWSRIYEFQRDSVKLLSDATPAMLRARLQAIELDLLDIDKTHAKTFAGNIKDLIEKQGDDVNALRAMLVEALTYLNDESESSFSQLVGWQTKAVWLVGVGCTLIVVLAFAVGNAVLFIAGATGGYLSRLARQLKRADTPTDYGASWTTLFLSPIVGALSGWFGILLIVLLADSRLGVLGPAFQQIEWTYPLAPLTLGLAFALGFSERLFDGIISSLEDKVDSERQSATQPKPPSSPVQAPVVPAAPKAAPLQGNVPFSDR